MSRMPVDENNKGFQCIHPGTTQILAYTSTAAACSTFQIGTRVVSVYASTDCFLKIASAPSAASGDGSSFFQPGGMIAVYGVGDNDRLSAIRVSSSGSLYITEGV